MASIWLKEVDTALKALTSSIVKCYNQQGALEVVPAVIGYPEVTERVEYPIVVIQNSSARFSTERYDLGNHEVITQRNAAEKQLTLEELMKPYDLFYQIDFCSIYQEDIDEMTRRWSSRLMRFNLLDVKDSSGAARQVFMEDLSTGTNTVLYQDSQRVFHSIINYLIHGEVDEELSRTLPMITEINVRRKSHG